jgi:hypothetical protein
MVLREIIEKLQFWLNLNYENFTKKLCVSLFTIQEKLLNYQNTLQTLKINFLMFFLQIAKDFFNYSLTSKSCYMCAHA